MARIDVRRDIPKMSSAATTVPRAFQQDVRNRDRCGKGFIEPRRLRRHEEKCDNERCQRRPPKCKDSNHCITPLHSAHPGGFITTGENPNKGWEHRYGRSSTRRAQKIFVEKIWRCVRLHATCEGPRWREGPPVPGVPGPVRDAGGAHRTHAGPHGRAAVRLFLLSGPVHEAVEHEAARHRPPHTHDYKHRCGRCGQGFVAPGKLRRHKKNCSAGTSRSNIQRRSHGAGPHQSSPPA